MNLAYRFIQPLDLLFLRGNQLFGDPGSYGEAMMPPWPSVAAGALRSRILSDDFSEQELQAFSKGQKAHASLGTPTEPGSFTLVGCHLARQQGEQLEIIMPLPADLVVQQGAQGLQLKAMQPLPVALASSYPLPCLPVLGQQERVKAEGGYWLTQAGWQAYLDGKLPAVSDLLPASSLWRLDARVGIGMSEQTRAVEEGKLFSMQALAMSPGVGFVLAVAGAEPPTTGLLRFGGDGRAVKLEAAAPNMPEPDYQAICQAGRCRLVLTSPGLFTQGWLPNGAVDGHFNLAGVKGRLVCSAVSRAETISGWDLANKQPKTAQRVAPAGSLYWLDDLQATPEALRKLAENGLWSDACEDAQRRAEGFNRVAIAAWND